MFTILFFCIIGCGDASMPGKTWNKEESWHTNVGWKAEDYFTDPKVIALCNAIEKKDIAEMDKLIADGADVKTIGKGI
ncbi:MAG: hypothetical protein LBQ54_15150 [Planctomycetaceae bacterium]|jgi:hypothetical protein|nr:hypothetical protein [Planctomycetaceae bacterium]